MVEFESLSIGTSLPPSPADDACKAVWVNAVAAHWVTPYAITGLTRVRNSPHIYAFWFLYLICINLLSAFANKSTESGAWWEFFFNKFNFWNDHRGAAAGVSDNNLISSEKSLSRPILVMRPLQYRMCYALFVRALWRIEEWFHLLLPPPKGFIYILADLSANQHHHHHLDGAHFCMRIWEEYINLNHLKLFFALSL